MPAKKKTQVKEEVQQETGAIDTFLKHQQKALEEAGKAVLGLLPADFREHSTTAVKESYKGVDTVVTAVTDEISKNIRDVRERVEKVTPRFRKADEETAEPVAEKA